MSGNPLVWGKTEAELAVLTCKEVSQLVSDSMVRELSVGERFVIRFHLLYCGACRRFRLQIRFLRIAVRRYVRLVQEGQLPDLPGLSDAARDRISRALRNA
jgi:hypothetical protein